MSTSKQCRTCGEVKVLEDFHRNKNTADGRLNQCKVCALARYKAEYHKNPELFRERRRRQYRAQLGPSDRSEYLRNWNLKRTFGLTHEDYEALLEAQGGGCAVCGRPPGKRHHAIDHDHETNKVRGILCGNCNRALGYLGDDHSRILALANYLQNGGSVLQPINQGDD